MIYYKEEKKKLVIPSGFVMIPIDCDEAIEQAREDGYREGFADGSSATCDTEEGTYSLTDDFDGEETVFPSEGKTGFNKIVIVDNGYGDAKYDEGYADGIADCSGSTDCSSAITEAYQSGITEGIAQQKSLLGSATFTHNDTFTNNSGWSSVTVNVPKEVVLGAWVDSPFLSGLSDTTYRRLFDPEHSIVDGWGEVNLEMKYLIAQSKAEQKALMSATTFTQNGLYTRENGWSAVTVDVPQCDCSSAITEAYNSGITEGMAEQKALLTSTAITANGTYTRTDGWNSVEVNVPQTGSTPILQSKTVTATTTTTTVVPDSGYDGLSSVVVDSTDIYNDGYADGQADCPECDCSIEVEDAKAMAVGEVNGQMVYFLDGINHYCVDVQGDFREGDTAIINLKIGSTFDPSDPDCYINIFSNNQQGTNWNYSEGEAYFIFRIYGGGLMVILYDGQEDTTDHHIQWNTQFSFSPNEDYRIVINSQEGLGSSSSMKVYITNETRGTFTSGYTTDAPRFTQVQSNNPFVINGIRKVENGDTTYEGMFGDWYLKSFEIFRPVSQYSQNNELVAAYGYLERTIVNIDGTRYEGVYYDLGGTEITCAVLGEIQKLKIIF